MSHFLRLILFCAAGLLSLLPGRAAEGPAGGADAKTKVPLKVVALNSVLAELSADLGADDVSVLCLVQPGVDPHTFNPAPADVKALAQADLILASGFNLEPYLDKLVSSSASRTRLVAASSAVLDPVSSVHSEQGHAGHEHGEVDPHWWHGIGNIRSVAMAIARTFSELRPESAAQIQTRLKALNQRLDALQTWVRAEVATLPPESRHLVTSHDAFGYLARDCGFQIHPLNGISPEAEPDAKSLGQLIDLIRSLKIKAVFVDNTENPKLLTAMLKESGAKIGGTLYADGLGPVDSPAANIDAMFRHNIRTIVEALR
jgi:zinc/manganese transport system substrate-binding protein